MWRAGAGRGACSEINGRSGAWRGICYLQNANWLESAYSERSPYLVFLQIEPRMDALRSERAFQELLGRIGLADIHPAPVDAGEAAMYLR